MNRWIWTLATLTGAAITMTAQGASLPPDQLQRLVAKCAPQVTPSTMLALIAHESGGDPLAIGVNGANRKEMHLATAAHASAAADSLLKAQRSADFGLGQINSANLKRLGLTTTTVFEPCRNLAAAAKLLTEAYVKWRPTAANDQDALNRALSTYNTGSPVAGVANGYVAAVRQEYTVPGIEPAHANATAAVAVQVEAKRREAPAWDVYGAAYDKRSTPAPAASTAEPVMVFGAKGVQQ